MKTLKLCLFLMLALCTCSLSSCSKDKETAEPTAEEIILGKWFIASVENDGVLETITDCEKNSYFEFESDGTYIIESYELEGTECVPFTIYGDYSITSDKKKLILTQKGRSTVSEIQELSPEEITLITDLQKVVLRKGD